MCYFCGMKTEKHIYQDYMKIATLREPFVTGTGHLPFAHGHLWKTTGGLVCLCLQGTARVTIDLQEYTFKEHTQMLLVPGTIFRINEVSDNFTLQYFCFSRELFQEACLHMVSSFITYLKENPCYTLSKRDFLQVNGLLQSVSIVYIDKKKHFRTPIAKSHLQILLLCVYDKYQQFYNRRKVASDSRQDELFRNFITLLNEHSDSEREVAFYANRLQISTKYLSGICKHIVGNSPKEIIDSFVIMHIKVMLRSTDISMVDIADRLKFPDLSYMGRYFKRHEGITLTEYRTGRGRKSQTPR